MTLVFIVSLILSWHRSEFQWRGRVGNRNQYLRDLENRGWEGRLCYDSDRPDYFDESGLALWKFANFVLLRDSSLQKIPIDYADVDGDCFCPATVCALWAEADWDVKRSFSRGAASCVAHLRL